MSDTFVEYFASPRDLQSTHPSSIQVDIEIHLYVMCPRRSESRIIHREAAASCIMHHDLAFQGYKLGQTHLVASNTYSWLV